MADGVIQVAPDSTGAKLKTYTETVSANTVHRQVVVLDSARTRTGLYRVDSGQLSVTAAADAATAGKYWLINPVGSTVAVSVKATQLSYSASAATAMPTAPTISVERVTFTGTASGATITPAKRVRTAVSGQALDATAVGSVRTASTGLTLAAGESIRAWALPAILTAVGTYGGYFTWDPDEEDSELILAAGEGVVFRQAVAGTTTDVRRINISITWEEFTAP